MLNHDYKEMLQLFEKHRVRFLVVGAYALAVHGFPRSTGDIDLWVRADADNAKRVMLALAEFGAPVAQVSQDFFLNKGMVYQVGVAPCRIDILTDISGGIDFDAAEQAGVTIDFEGVHMIVLGIAELIRNKQATGRPKDLEDVVFLQGHRP